MVNKSPRRRLEVQERREQLIDVGVELLATRPWDELTMADIADAAQVSKPLLYHYFSTKSDLYVAAVITAMEQLRDATNAFVNAPSPLRIELAVAAHLDWIEANAQTYETALRGAMSGRDWLQDKAEETRTEVIERIALTFEVDATEPLLRIALRGWLGFLEATSLEWLRKRDVPKAELVDLLVCMLPSAIGAATSGLDGPRQEAHRRRPFGSCSTPL